MKPNIIKDFALTTIDKAQQLAKLAEDAGLALSVDVNLCDNCGSISLYKLDSQGKIIGGSIYFRHHCFLDRVSNAKAFAYHLNEVEGEIAGYKAKDLARLEKQQTELRAQLAAVNKDLRKVRRAAK